MFYCKVFSPPMPLRVLMNFRGFPPGCGDSVADFWGWDAHEAQLTLSRWCEWWYAGRWNTRRGLKPKSINYPDHGHHGNLSLQGKNSHGRTGNRTRDLMISSHRPWPLDHEPGLFYYNVNQPFLLQQRHRINHILINKVITQHLFFLCKKSSVR